MRPEYLLRTLCRIILPAALLLVLISPAPAMAQYFGRNHVQYEKFNFKVLETNHFDIYHYLDRSEEHTSELQSLMRISYAVFCLKKKKKTITSKNTKNNNKEQ